ncbi:hypothetical protein BVH03_21445 [Pseudomonas sp. PA15(2017)]|uniref:hypothetical protein n=1 Tax=Pseudomonas sp. PA15(2017) TaxID=1932111 RepID=UPI00095C6BCB|nr:hypothetical protein [Pseudomonas sp. PA15(2017)]OLU23636.1 hypothetical protein BVH03_21445 [Pseudomonas sp. PA15(2017)]
MSRHDAAALTTPDGRYLVIRGRLWRLSNPALSESRRQVLVNELMDARRLVKAAKAADDAAALARARAQVQAAKVGLGERGPVWWCDGTPDYNRYLVANTPYADWFETLERKGMADRR